MVAQLILGGHVLGNLCDVSETIIKLGQDFVRTNVKSKFYENWTKNVTSRVFIIFQYSYIRKTALPADYVFLPNASTLKLVKYIIKTNYPRCGAHLEPRHMI